jgi:hypothetical protein
MTLRDSTHFYSISLTKWICFSPHTENFRSGDQVPNSFFPQTDTQAMQNNYPDCLDQGNFMLDGGLTMLKVDERLGHTLRAAYPHLRYTASP